MIGLVNGNALQIPLADNSVHCIVTSPPYWSLRDYSVSGQLGLEPTPEEYVENMVAVFREVRRVLRDDGVLWLNIGDSYAGGNQTGRNDNGRPEKNRGWAEYDIKRTKIERVDNLKPLDLVGIPWRLAMALQADGWYLRSDVIWSKPNPMPESVNGWRWERHKVKIASAKITMGGNYDTQIARNHGNMIAASGNPDRQPEYIDCPGCPTCAPNDGLVLRRGAWRPTKAHEYVFLLTKSDRYFCDAEAVREIYTEPLDRWGGDTTKETDKTKGDQFAVMERPGRDRRPNPAGRNRRTVWQIATQPYSGAHFATFPEALVEPCVKAATSERGCCPVCGSQWARVVESNFVVDGTYRYKTNKRDSNNPQADSGLPRGTVDIATLGFRRTCEHDAPPVPCTVFDPFAGTGTVGVVAQKLGHSFVGLELSLEYIELAKERIAKSNGYHVGRLL